MPDAYSADAARSDADRAIGARIAMQVVVRTRFYDDYLLSATRDGVRQVALLAAGLDTRAFRLDWPAGTKVFELDLPDMVEFKETVLAQTGAVPTATRAAVRADLTADWTTPLVAAGFDESQPTAWLIEGLLVYLTYDDAAQLLETVGQLSAPGSTLSCELGRGARQLAQIAATRSGAGASEAVSLWQGGIEDVPGWLAGNGWSAETHDLGALAASYGRPITTESQSGFLIARR